MEVPSFLHGKIIIIYINSS